MLRIACLLLWFLVLPLHAAPVAVPDPLQPWQAWSLEDEQFRDCALLANRAGGDASDFACAWPGQLNIDADAAGAQFSVRMQVQAESWVPLPGDATTWPQAVHVDGQAKPVIEREGMPRLFLGPGTHRIEGHLEWTRRPQSLAVPMTFGLVRLQVDGVDIVPVRHENGALVLGRTASEAPEADSLTLRVYRLLSDGVPAMLETRIEVAASGQAREEVFGPVLPAGFVPTSLGVDAGWPARLEPDGRLRVQVQPATTVVRVYARAVAPLEKAQMVKVAAPWPAQEVWSYQAAPSLRVTNATGPAQVDPAQAGVPQEWRELPAFALDPGTGLSVELRSRGLGSDQANRLTLRRQAWLDFSGAGWTFDDRINGTMRQGWRLDALPPYRLEQARDVNEDEPLLVTQGTGGATGVEWRTNNVQLSAGLRMQPAQSHLAVTGWRQTFDSVDVTLHLPFGYQLLAAPGADRADNSWLDRWDLLDVFLVAVLTLFAWHAIGRAAAAATLGYLLVAFHEPGRPLYWLGAVLALGLVLRFLPAGRLHTFGVWIRRGAMVVLVLIALPFATTQLRQALYPQLEPSTGGYGYAEGTTVNFTDAPQAQMANAPPPPPAAPAPMEPAREQGLASDSASKVASSELDTIRVTGGRLRKADLLDRYSKNTVVQTGRGLPTWQHGHSYQLSWSGPVTADQQVRLWLSPPWLTRMLRVLCVGLLAWLLLRLAGTGLPKPGAWRPSALPKAPLAAAATIMLAMLSLPARAAEGPSPELLAELKARLTRPPACAPHCADIAAAQVVANGQRLEVALDVHAATRTAVALPMDAEALSVESLRVDGEETAGVRREGGQYLLGVERGVHRVQVAYRITGDRVSLAFPLAPRHIDFDGDGWQAGGISEGRLLTETLGLSRVREAQSGGERGEAAQEFPPYVRLERTLTLGLDWTVRTRMVRVAPAEGGFSVDVPLLPGEKVLTAGLRVREGRIEVPMPDGASFVEWESNLDKAEAITVTAPGLAERAEVWRVLVSPLWRAAFSGVPESVNTVESNDWHEFTFHPLPGETLVVAITKPAAVAGATQAILDVQLNTQVGQRASEHTLSFNLRASQGGERVLTLPAGAELLSVQRDGLPLSLRLDDGKLSLAVSPGSQNYVVRFRDKDQASLRNSTPTIGLGLPAANISLDLGLPDNRWVLATHGPRVGPAVLYWGELAVLLLVAYGLSRLRWTPLRLHEWLLLGIGFSTFSWIALAFVVAWLFAMAWRERQGAAHGESKLVFDAGQIALVMLTIAALGFLVSAIPNGLLGHPDMHIVAPEYGQSALHWFADQSTDALPTAGAVSVPMWVYRAAMLAWALWLAMAVLRWMKWALKAWTTGGWWRPLRKPKVAPVAVDPDATPPPPADDPMP